MRRTVSARAATVALVVAALAAHLPQPAAAQHCYVARRIIDCDTDACNGTTNRCTPCRTDGDCYYRAQYCRHGRTHTVHNGTHAYNTSSANTCELRKWYHSSAMWLCLTALAGLAICTIGVLAGVGGGGAMTPAYAGFLGLPLPLAVIGSLASICGQGFLNVPYLMPQRFPYGPHRPMINYPVLALWYPITASGTLIGAHWKHAVPDWFRNVMLIVVSFLVSIRVLQQARNARARERAEKLDVVRASFAGPGGTDSQNRLVQEHKERLLQESTTPIATISGTVNTQDHDGAAPTEESIPLNVDLNATHDTSSGDYGALAVTTPKPLSRHKKRVHMSREGLDTYGDDPQHHDGATGDRSTSHRRGSRNNSARHSHYGDDGRSIAHSERHAASCAASHASSAAWSFDAEGVALMAEKHHEVHDRDEDDMEDEEFRLPRYPWHYIISLVLTMATVTVSRWGSRVSDCNGRDYWLSLIAGFIVLIIIFGVWRTHIWWIRGQVLEGDLPPHHEQIAPTFKATFLFPMISLIAGFCSATVGIGGGTLINPLLLEAGLLPEEASATGGIFTFLIAVDSTITALTHTGSGSLSPVWILYFCVIGFVSTVIGRLVLLPYFKRRGATYVIVVALAASLLLTFAAVGIYGGMGFAAMHKYGVPFTFTQLCPRKKAG